MQISRNIRVDSEGVADVTLWIDEDTVSHLLGYVGPSEMLAHTIQSDQIDVDLDSGVVGVLTKVFTNPERRRRGIGGSLVSGFLAICMERKATAVYLYAALSDEDDEHGDNEQGSFNLVGWYERFGFCQLNEDEEPVMRLRFKFEAPVASATDHHHRH
jgi:ribosomal protein S18 acetylase RimI-like enzyme